jgi:ABC-type transporter MlaC component
MTMILSRLIAPALFAILFVFPSSSPAASPRTEVKATVDQVIATLKDETLSAAARREKLTSIIRPRQLAQGDGNPEAALHRPVFRAS